MRKLTRANRRKRAQSNAASEFGCLEPRVLLAIVGTPVANYFDGIVHDQTGWQYFWNAPDGWSDTHPGTPLSGSIDDVESYRPLEKAADSFFWTADGDIDGRNSPPANYLRLGPIGGVPGAPAIDSQDADVDEYDRYVIAAYTIQEPGNFSISDSRIELAGPSADGVEVRVHVNSSPAILNRAVDRDAETENYHLSNFDTPLGYLQTGDQVYVAFGGLDSQNHDFFFTDFTVYKTSSEIVVGDFVDDFLESNVPQEGWNYLWNAPLGWQPGQNLGDLNSGAIDEVASFRPLESTGESGIWTADGDLAGTNNGPSNFVRFGKGYGVPGAHAGMFVLDESTSPAAFVENGLDRYSIAAFTVSNSGLYAITDSFLRTLSSANVDGVEVRVFVNDELPIVIDQSNAGAQVDFDSTLGFLKQGDTVYVAYGANENQNSDHFETDFSITRIVPRVEPLRELENTTSFFVGDADPVDNRDLIATTIAAARTHQETNPGPVEIQLEPNQIYRVHPASVDDDAIFQLLRYNKDGVTYRPNNMVINGNGSTILIEDPTRGLLHIDNGLNIIVQNLEVDYSTLPFTQGTIIHVNHDSKHIFLRLDPDFEGTKFPKPNDPQFDGMGRRGFSRWGYAVKPDIPGQLKDGSEWLYAPLGEIVDTGNNVFRIRMNRTLGLDSQDRFVLLSRYNTGGLFTSYHESEQISYINVTAYAGPSTFVSGNHNRGLNVIDSQVLVKPGRLKSTNGDGVHAQSNRVGPWIEGSTFDGISDDVANFYTTAHTILEQSEDGKSFVFANVGFPGSEWEQPYDNLGFSRSFQVGDHLTFYQSSTGELLANVRIEAVEYDQGRATRVTVDQPVYGVTIEPSGLGNGDDNYLNDTTVYNDELGSDFVVQDSQFLNSRRFGIYLMSRRGQVVDSVFEGISDQAIAGHNETGWPLGLFPDDVLIQNNLFSSVGFSGPYQREPEFTGVIGFNMDRFDDDVLVDAPSKPIRDLRILDNEFRDWAKSAIAIRNTSQALIANNVFRAARAHEAADPANAGQNYAIRVDWSDQIEIVANVAVDTGINSAFVEEFLAVGQNVESIDVGGNEIVEADQLAKLIRWDEQSGYFAKDSSDQMNDARLIGADPAVSGRVGGGIGFNGHNQFAFSYDNSSAASRAQRTIATWANLDDASVTSRKQVVYEDGSIVSGTNIYVFDGRVYFGNWASTADPGSWLSHEISSGAWHHFSMTIDADGEMNAYVDGNWIGAIATNASQLGPSFVAFAAADRNGTRFHDGPTRVAVYTHHLAGRLDETRIYNRVLSENEVESLART